MAIVAIKSEGGEAVEDVVTFRDGDAFWGEEDEEDWAEYESENDDDPWVSDCGQSECLMPMGHRLSECYRYEDVEDYLSNGN